MYRRLHEEIKTTNQHERFHSIIFWKPIYAVRISTIELSKFLESAKTSEKETPVPIHEVCTGELIPDHTHLSLKCTIT